MMSGSLPDHDFLLCACTGCTSPPQARSRCGLAAPVGGFVHPAQANLKKLIPQTAFLHSLSDARTYKKVFCRYSRSQTA